MARNSELILCSGIRLDREYSNVIDYSESDMLSLCRTNKIAGDSNYSFIRNDKRLVTSIPYSTALQGNYIAFQNPDYSNKWFFGFVDDVKYVNDNSTEIFYTIDYFSTWFRDLTLNDCMVIREHTNDDSVGKNIVDENVQLSEYICNKFSQYEYGGSSTLGTNNFNIVIGVTSDSNGQAVSGNLVDNIYSGVKYYVYGTSTTEIAALNSFIESYAGRQDAIVCLFYAPKEVAPLRNDHILSYSNTPTVYYLNDPDTTLSNNKIITLTNGNIDGYVPKNNKLLQYPYRYLLASNNNGTEVVYKYEDFYTKNATTGEKTIANQKFQISGVLSVGCSVRMIPLDYKGITKNEIEGINLGKYPALNWNSDAFTNWMTQNGVNTALNVAGSVLSTGVGVVTGNPVGIASGVLSIAGSIGEIYKQSLMPPQSHGNINSGDVVTASGLNDFLFYDMSIKKESAQVIDDYFSECGYKTLRNKIPNITGRTYWNYVQISSDDSIGHGSIPADALSVINNAFHNGVTIWHNHANIGNYELTNSIVTP